MPMIDLHAPAGTFADPHEVARSAASIVKDVERVPDIPLFRNNTVAFVHELPAAAISDAAGSSIGVRVQVLTNDGALDREQQLAVVRRLTDLVVEASGGLITEDRVWVLLTEAQPGGWGLFGHAQTNEEIVGLARAELARLSPE
ncbi:4-oxalocrotonate tautomerase family protein [Agromyces sp. NPDC057865]|uniref:tautomerase family protein n=1 Tax=Agromyces sp. NPDC057865 TaxID=3346267 RepID=UPI0036714553